MEVRKACIFHPGTTGEGGRGGRKEGRKRRKEKGVASRQNTSSNYEESKY
jgi:hypothetical protein